MSSGGSTQWYASYYFTQYFYTLRFNVKVSLILIVWLIYNVRLIILYWYNSYFRLLYLSLVFYSNDRITYIESWRIKSKQFKYSNRGKSHGDVSSHNALITSDYNFQDSICYDPISYDSNFEKSAEVITYQNVKLSINCNDSSKLRYSSGNDLSFHYSNTSDLSCDCSNRSESSYDNWLQVVASHVAMSKVSWTKARIRDNLRCEDSIYDDSLSRDL